MANTYRKSGNTIFIRKLIQDIKKLKVELNEHRYGLERNVERETAHLLKRVALLESCNASLSDRLAQAQKEIAALKRSPAQAIQAKNTISAGRAARLYVMNNPAQQAEAGNVQEKWGGHVTAA